MTRFDRREVEAGALVVVRIEPEHAAEHVARRGEVAPAPEAETVAMEAAQVGPVVDQTPWEETLEVVS
jgi:hypothetical protein